MKRELVRGVARCNRALGRTDASITAVGSGLEDRECQALVLLELQTAGTSEEGRTKLLEQVLWLCSKLCEWNNLIMLVIHDPVLIIDTGLESSQ